MSLEQLKEQLPEEVVKVIIELEAFDFKQAEENSEQIVLIKLAELPSQYAYDGVYGKGRMEKTGKGNDKVIFTYGKKN